MEIEPHVVRRRLVGDGIVELTLALPDGSALPQWEPGAHIDLHLGEHVRQYSLTGLETSPSEWVVSILREPASRGGSAFAHDNVVEGSVVRTLLPRNNFDFSAVGSAEVVFVAGGIGVTPTAPDDRGAGGAGRETGRSSMPAGRVPVWPTSMS